MLKIIASLFLVLVLIVGCRRLKPQSAPVNQPASVGANQNTNQEAPLFDTNDYLDAALNELDSVDR